MLLFKIKRLGRKGVDWNYLMFSHGPSAKSADKRYDSAIRKKKQFYRAVPIFEFHRSDKIKRLYQNQNWKKLKFAVQNMLNAIDLLA